MRRFAMGTALASILAGSAAPADDAPVIEELRNLIRAEMERLDIPGLTVALVDGKEIVWQEGFGVADRWTGRRASIETVYRVGSISKLFAAVATMQLAERGLVDLDAPIATYAPEFAFRNPFGPETPIALRHLHAHRAGILRESPVGHYFDPTEPGIEKTVRSIIGSELVLPVGAAAKYSNLGPTVAGYILERVTGTPFAAYTAARILEPAGMTSSSFLRDKEAIRRNLATGTMIHFDGSPFPAPTFELGTIPAGNLYATAGDLARFMIALFDGGVGPGGRILAKKSIDRMLTIQFPDGGTSGYGLGFFLSRLFDRKLASHNGAVYGFSSSFAALPEEKLGAVVLNNLECANGFNAKVVRTALRAMLQRARGAAIPPLPEPIASKAGELEAYAGKYVAPRREAWARVEGGELRLRILGVEQLLRPIGPDRFIADGRLGYGTEYRFGRDRDGRIAGLSCDGVQYRRLSAWEPSADVPAAWAKYVGQYGWPHNILRVYVRDGRLTCLVEWFFEYPLEPLRPGVFAFPDYGLYERERIAFIEDDRGRVVEARMGSVPFPRLAVEVGR